MDFAFQMLVLAYLVTAAVEDVRRKHIDVRILFVSTLVIVTLEILLGRVVFGKENLMGLIPGMIVLVVSKLSSEAIGMGDAVIITWLGFMCGVSVVINVLMFACSICFVAAMIMFIIGKKQPIPFVPFLCTGYLCTLGFTYLQY